MPTNIEKAKRELTTIWRQVSGGNEQEEKIIREFETDYESKPSVWWYSKYYFLYSTLNKALREHNIDMIFAMRFFLVDLLRQLQGLHGNSHHNSTNEQIHFVYRGQSMSPKELNVIRASQGKLVTFNSFVSATANLKVASAFAASCDPVLPHVLLEFKIDTSLSGTKSYANISAYSNHPDEEEVLIMLGLIFRIDKVEYAEDEKRWEVKLSLRSENDFELKDLVKQMKDEVGDQIVSLGFLLYRQGEYEKAKQFFERLLVEEKYLSIIDIAQCSVGLGVVTLEMNLYDAALKHLRIALSLWETLRDNVEIKGVREAIAGAYYAIGLVQLQKNEPELALSMQKMALDIYFPLNHPRLSNVYQAIASIYFNKNKFTKAIHYYKKSIEVNRKNNLPGNHSNFGNNYMNMGKAYAMIYKINQAYTCLTKADNIFIKSLPPKHPSILKAKGSMAAMREMLTLLEDYNLTEDHLPILIDHMQIFLPELIQPLTSYLNF
ncbi:unnamed protein product [Didymodactylos carnosus]|uniref:NAD(P)(+)--arginine ADP-ribosyltransferase n=1 Tax=Didymodactylos carnosus TaxID=1234261 RepID=A0A814P499_9BILA|nr:unnamed protein product [Didymodactylos carnosus]CAF3867371.1 unnamed protein product [Didymodactylos carnosus]